MIKICSSFDGVVLSRFNLKCCFLRKMTPTFSHKTKDPFACQTSASFCFKFWNVCSLYLYWCSSNWNLSVLHQRDSQFLMFTTILVKVLKPDLNVLEQMQMFRWLIANSQNRWVEIVSIDCFYCSLKYCFNCVISF